MRTTLILVFALIAFGYATSAGTTPVNQLPQIGADGNTGSAGGLGSNGGDINFIVQKDWTITLQSGTGGDGGAGANAQAGGHGGRGGCNPVS